MRVVYNPRNGQVKSLGQLERRPAGFKNVYMSLSSWKVKAVEAELRDQIGGGRPPTAAEAKAWAEETARMLRQSPQLFRGAW